MMELHCCNVVNEKHSTRTEFETVASERGNDSSKLISFISSSVRSIRTAVYLLLTTHGDSGHHTAVWCLRIANQPAHLAKFVGAILKLSDVGVVFSSPCKFKPSGQPEKSQPKPNEWVAPPLSPRGLKCPQQAGSDISKNKTINPCRHHNVSVIVSNAEISIWLMIMVVCVETPIEVHRAPDFAAR